MLKFFRKIRSKLLFENKLKKYLIYAIGEILLVMIGILLALQVNNWNQNKQNSNKEAIVLTELKENLESNIKQFHSSIVWEESRIEGIKKVLYYIENKKAWNDTISEEVKWFRLIEEFHISKSAFQSLKSNGFDLISSKNLRKEIIKLYDVTYYTTEKRISEYGLVQLQFRTKYFNHLFKWDYKKGQIVQNNNQKDYTMQEFENLLSNRIFIKEYVVKFNQASISATKEVIKLIDAELQKLL